jgi:hypothetical protein
MAKRRRRVAAQEATRASRGLTAADARRIALSLPGAVEASHMGHPDFRVGGKIFASLPADGASVSLKTTPADLDALVVADPAAYRAIWGGRWLGVQLAHATRDALTALIADSWALVAPKRLLQQTTAPERGWGGDGEERRRRS